MIRTINLNADMGESYGKFTVGNDAALMKIIKSANIACGFHAGDPTIMVQTVQLAKDNGVSIGAHPSFLDLQGFGRRQINMSPREIEYMVTYQIGALQAIAHGAGQKVTHVKPHGSLNNMAHVDLGIATAIAKGIKAADKNLIFVANALSEMVTAGHNTGLRVAEEAYADRTYTDAGLLTPRSQTNAVIHDAEQAIKQVLSFIDEQAIITASGKRLPTRIKTFCTHGDEPGADVLAGKISAALAQRGIALVPDRKSTRLNSSHPSISRMPSSA